MIKPKTRSPEDFHLVNKLKLLSLFEIFQINDPPFEFKEQIILQVDNCSCNAF